MKRTAHNACQILAEWIIDGATFAWAVADRIERRFKCVGCTEHYVETWQRQHRDHLASERRAADLRHPNRLSYLHR